MFCYLVLNPSETKPPQSRGLGGGPHPGGRTHPPSGAALRTEPKKKDTIKKKKDEKTKI